MNTCVCEVLMLLRLCVVVVFCVRALTALYQPFILCGEPGCQQSLADLEPLQASPQGANISGIKGSVTSLTRAAQRPFAYIRFRETDLRLHGRAAQLPANTLRETTDSLQTWFKKEE